MKGAVAGRENRNGNNAERRKSARYALRVPVLFSAADDGVHRRGGFTRELSTENAYVLCEKAECPEVGSFVSVEVLLPPIDSEAHGVRLRAEGRVARSSAPGEPSGFAVVTDFGMQAKESAVRIPGARKTV